MTIEKCPVCNGQKTVSKPPYVAGDIDHWMSCSMETYPCPTCGGKGYVVVDDSTTINELRATIDGHTAELDLREGVIEEQREEIERSHGHIDRLESRSVITTPAICNRLAKMPNDTIADMIDEHYLLHSREMRERIASALHDHTRYWMKVAIKYPMVTRGFLDKTFDELAAIDKLAPLRDADTILDVIRGERR